MTELQIDKQRIVLPRSLNMKVIEENPFFTKNGTYTLDITLSLEEDENAIAYQHINRMNVVDGIGVDIETGKPLNRTARLVVDNEVVLNGTEILTAWTNTSVTIQLVSGNSELNFIIGGDRKLRDLDLGKAERYSGAPGDWASVYLKIWDDIQLSYPDRDWQLLPYYTNEKDIQDGGNPYSLYVGNTYTLYNPPSGHPLHDRYISQYNPRFSRQVPQPYLCFIIKKVLEVLGYNLIYNSIAEHAVFKNLYIVHGFQIMEFSKMLPNWTVNEFLSKIELWLDCTFIINKFSKNVSLYFNSESYKDIYGKQTLDVEDDYSSEIDNENKTNVYNSNIGYSLDSDTYYKYMDLGFDIRKDSLSENSSLTISEFVDYMNLNPTSVRKNTIYKIENNYFIIYSTDYGLTLKRVESFKPLFRDDNLSELDVEFDIIPASMAYGYTKILSSFGNPVPELDYWVQVPIAGEYDPLYEYGIEPNPVEDPDIDIQSLIEGSTSTSKGNQSSKMRLAIYNGVHKVDPKDTPASLDVYYPVCYVESLAEYVQEIKKAKYFIDRTTNPFRLDWLENNVYTGPKIDTTKTYKLAFIDPGKIDIMSKFIANNKAFRCAKIERTITIDGFAEMVTGDFYPYNN